VFSPDQSPMGVVRSMVFGPQVVRNAVFGAANSPIAWDIADAALPTAPTQAYVAAATQSGWPRWFLARLAVVAATFLFGFTLFRRYGK